MPPYYKKTLVRDGIEYGIRGDNTVVVISVKGYVSELVIPEYIEDCPVVAIAFRAFWKYNNLIRITLPKTLTKVDTEAFARCEKLATVIFHAKTVQIRRSAFSGCGKLLKIAGYELSFTQAGTFDGCARLEEIDAVVTGEVFPFTFLNCKRLEELYFAENVSILEDAFKGCMSLEKLHFGSNATVDEKVIEFISKRTIFCKSDCPLAELGYSGTQVVFNG